MPDIELPPDGDEALGSGRRRRELLDDMPIELGP
jgi:hypothetical protein